MDRKPPLHDIDESQLDVTDPKRWAAGIPGVAVSLQRGVEQMGVARTASTLRLLNQREGFDSPGCAWAEPQGHRKPAELCEHGAEPGAEAATEGSGGHAFDDAH